MQDCYVGGGSSYIYVSGGLMSYNVSKLTALKESISFVDSDSAEMWWQQSLLTNGDSFWKDTTDNIFKCFLFVEEADTSETEVCQNLAKGNKSYVHGYHREAGGNSYCNLEALTLYRAAHPARIH